MCRFACKLLSVLPLIFVSVADRDSAQADIYRWDNGELIPGTEGIEPGPGQQLNQRNLQYASLSHVDLSRSSFERSDLTYASLTASNLRHANLAAANLTNALLKGCNSDSDSCRGADFTNATLAGANLTGARVSSSILDGADLREANLTNAELFSTRLAGADLDGAHITGALMTAITRYGFTRAQLYATANHRNKDLQRVWIRHNDFTEWDFSGQNLTDSRLSSNTFIDADLSGVIAIGTNLGDTQLAGADLRGANLINAALFSAEGLEFAIFGNDSVYSQWTLFPDGFDPSAAGLTLVPLAAGDFDGNGDLDAFDVDRLAMRIRGEQFYGHWPDSMLDVDDDSEVGEKDLDRWVKELKGTFYGDANLDREFNSTDLVQVFQASEYEDRMEPCRTIGDGQGGCRTSVWSTGDWNADGDFTSSDLVVALQDGGYEQGPRPALAAVPEPNGIGIMTIAALVAVSIRRRGG